MSRGLIVAKTETGISLEDCVLKGSINVCVRGNCMYWDDALEVCTRGSLKMTEKQRRERRSHQAHDAAVVAGSF